MASKETSSEDGPKPEGEARAESPASEKPEGSGAAAAEGADPVPAPAAASASPEGEGDDEEEDEDEKEEAAATSAPLEAAQSPKDAAKPKEGALSRNDRYLAIGSALVIALLVLLRIGGFGIWDPWELAAADVARSVAEGDLATPLEVPPFGPWLVARGFAIFGIHEWAGRLPVALAGLLSLLALAFGTSRASGVRVGALAALITASTPVFLLNSRGMMGAAPGYLGSVLVFLFALELASVDVDESRTQAEVDRARGIAAVGLLASIALAALGSGVLLGVAPPLLGVSVALVARGDLAPRIQSPRGLIAAGVAALGVIVGLGVLRAVLADVAGYSTWLGGAPRDRAVGTFEVVIEQVFHGFSPWTAVLPLGFGWLAFREEDPARPRRESLLGLAAMAWAAFAFAAVTVYDARYGTAPFPAPLALGVIAALGLQEVQARGGGSWAAGVVAALLALLLLRDFRGYPVTPTGGLALSDITAPEAFNPWMGWVATLVPFALLAFFGLARDQSDSLTELEEDYDRAVTSFTKLGRPQLTVFRQVIMVILLGAYWFGVPRRAIENAYRRGGANAAWLWFFAVLVFGVLAYGILSWTLPEDSRPQAVVAIITSAIALALTIARVVTARMGRDESRWVRIGLPVLAAILAGVALATGILSIEGLSSLAIRVGRYLLAVPFALVLAVAAFRGLRYGFHALGEYALVPLVVMGVITGGYVSLRWQPELSQHFSPREVYDTYNGLAAEGEPLGEYHVSGRAAAYYTDGEIEEIDNEASALQFLAREGRVWLAFRADDLAALDRAYRTRSSRHLFIVDARSSNVLLATNQPISGRADGNYLAEAILDVAPTPEFPVGASFDRRIELVGYDLESPRPGRIGPGDAIVVTWYWHCTAAVPGNYQIFLHVDGMGQRLNGDHDPVEGRYPVRLWSAGDIIVDRQELRIPANFPPGSYSFNIGFYSGETRLEVVAGAEDDANRAIAGTINVR